MGLETETGEHMEQHNERGPAAWCVTAITFVMAIVAWGLVFYGHGVYLEILPGRHGWSIGLISSAIFVAWATAVPATILVGHLLDRFNPAWCVIGGGLSIGIAVMLLGVIDAPWQMFIAYMLLGAGYPALAAPGISAILARWFERRFGLALSLALTGASIGGAAVPPALIFLSARYGFTFATGLLGALAIASMAIGGLWLARLDRAGPGGPRAGDDMARSWNRAAVLAEPAFWTVAGTAALALCAQVGFLAHQIPILSAQAGSQAAALVVTGTVVSAIVGRFAVGLLTLRLALHPLAAGCYVLQAAGIAMVNLADDFTLRVAGSLLAGFVVGAIVMLPPLLVRHAFGTANYGRIYAMTGVAFYLGAGLGPWLTGLWHDWSGGYAGPLWGLVAVHILAAIVVLSGPKRARRPERS